MNYLVAKPSIVVCALYKFCRLPGFAALQAPLLEQMRQLGVRGSLLLASEGINGTISGERQSIDALLTWLEAQPNLAPISCKKSFAIEHPFLRTKVKLKKEIVTMGVSEIDPLHAVGTYVPAHEWNSLISDPEVLLIDTRNDYEVQIGQFKNAVNPKTTSFSEFPNYVKANLDPHKHHKVAMYCTGGIRCEKSTAYLKQLGFNEVYHLEGGILKYLEEVPQEESLWQGECFVFDERVAVGHGLEIGEHQLCRACRRPINTSEMASKYYQAGVSCPRCIDDHAPEQKARFAERERQVHIAQQLGIAHLGEKNTVRRHKPWQQQTKLDDSEN